MGSRYPKAFGHRNALYFTALLIFMRRTIPADPSEPVEPAPPLSQVIKRRHAPWAHPPPFTFSKKCDIL